MYGVSVMSEPVYFYRYNGNYYDDGLRARAALDKYVGVKQTPGGWWIVPLWMWSLALRNLEEGETPRKAGARWISNTSRKRYAYPTKEEAWGSFCARREWRLVHLRRQLRHAEAIAQIPGPTEEYVTPSVLHLLGGGN